MTVATIDKEQSRGSMSDSLLLGSSNDLNEIHQLYRKRYVDRVKLLNGLSLNLSLVQSGTYQLAGFLFTRDAAVARRGT